MNPVPTATYHPVDLRACDLGVEVVLVDWCVASWCTRLRVRIESAPIPYRVAGARLHIQRNEGGASQPIETLPLVAVETSDVHTTLLFAALAPHATGATLEVTRLQTDDAGPPEPRLPAGFDPFDPDDPASDRDACARMLDAEDHDASLPPEWECRGCWAFPLTRPPVEAIGAGRLALDIFERRGPCAVALPWIAESEHGGVLAVDVVPAAWSEAGRDWKTWALETAAPPATHRPHFSLRVGAASKACDPLGPFGRLGTRLYAALPSRPRDSEQVPTELVLDALRDVALSPPIEHRFSLHTLEDEAAFAIPLGPLGLDGALRITIFDVVGDGATFLLLYQPALESTELAQAWIASASLLDGRGTEHVCQEDGTQALRDFRIDAPDGMRAMRFGNVCTEHDIVLRIHALDVVWGVAQPIPVTFDHGFEDPCPEGTGANGCKS